MIVRLIVAVLMALAMIAPGAHLFEIVPQDALSEDQYFVVQEIYRGWWLVGLLLPAALIANIVMAVTTGGTTRRLAAIAAGLVALNLLVFVIWTQPVNSVTSDWTVRVADWEALRRQWEYSHAVNAGITFAAFCAAACRITCKLKIGAGRDSGNCDHPRANVSLRIRSVQRRAE